MVRHGNGACLAPFVPFVLFALAQRLEQALQAVMVDLVHQREQPADFAAWEPFARQPVKVMPGQVGDESTLVFPEGHGDGDKAFKVWDLHGVILHDFAFPHAGTLPRLTLPALRLEPIVDQPLCRL